MKDPLAIVLLAALSGCAESASEAPRQAEPPSFSVAQLDLQLPAVGRPLARTVGADAAWWGTDGWSPVLEAHATTWTAPVAIIRPAPSADRVGVVWSDGGVSTGSSPTQLQSVASDGLLVRDLHWVQLDADPAHEFLLTHQESDVVRAYEDDGTQLWEQRWGADVDHVLSVQGHALRVAHTDGIGLVVRTPDGEVVSRNRPRDSGRVRQLSVVHDVGAFDGPSIALTHQKPGASPKADLYSPDGAASRGTLRPGDLIGTAGSVPLDSEHTVYADHDVDGTITVRILSGTTPVFSQILPHPSATMQLISVGDTPMVISEDGVRTFHIHDGSPTP